MKRNVQLLAFAALMCATGCQKEKVFDGVTQFTEGFEGVSTVDSLLTAEEDGWAATQVTILGNSVIIDTAIVHSGAHSLRCGADRSGEVVSKASIFKNDFALWEGDVIQVSAWYYVGDTIIGDWLFIMDLEESTPIGAGPGTRLAIVDGALALEHKYFQPSIFQPEATRVPFPTDRWVKVSLLLELSQQDKGRVRVYQDGQLVISADDWQTLPKDFLYNQQGTIGRYTNVEVGATANSSETGVIMWVDDVEVTKTP
jgi:hypothetical protein